MVEQQPTKGIQIMRTMVHSALSEISKKGNEWVEIGLGGEIHVDQLDFNKPTPKFAPEMINVKPPKLSEEEFQAKLLKLAIKYDTRLNKTKKNKGVGVQEKLYQLFQGKLGRRGEQGLQGKPGASTAEAEEAAKRSKEAWAGAEDALDETKIIAGEIRADKTIIKAVGDEVGKLAGQVKTDTETVGKNKKEIQGLLDEAKTVLTGARAAENNAAGSAATALGAVTAAQNVNRGQDLRNQQQERDNQDQERKNQEQERRNQAQKRENEKQEKLAKKFRNQTIGVVLGLLVLAGGAMWFYEAHENNGAAQLPQTDITIKVNGQNPQTITIPLKP